MWIRLLLLLAVGGIALALFRGGRGARHLAIRRLCLLAFTGFAALSVLLPELWTQVAQRIGVGRGTDLLLYGLIVAFLGYVATSYLRFQDLQRQVTLLSRRLALDEAPPARSAADEITDELPAVTDLTRVVPRQAPAEGPRDFVRGTPTR